MYLLIYSQLLAEINSLRDDLRKKEDELRSAVAEYSTQNTELRQKVRGFLVFQFIVDLFGLKRV